jgi:DNA-directed RNA polymerase subunit RPC12/RpoP
MAGKKPASAQVTNDCATMFLVPCSCGRTFAVSENYDREGTSWTRYLICPNCGKRHDPKNRLLRLGFQREGYWKVDGC